jgi:hypothetical protein
MLTYSAKGVYVVVIQTGEVDDAYSYVEPEKDKDDGYGCQEPHHDNYPAHLEK